MSAKHEEYPITFNFKGYKMGIFVEVDDEQFANTMREELINSYKMLKEDTNSTFCNIFSSDPDEERKEVKRHLKAFKTIINWYSTRQEWAEFKENDK